MVMMIIIIIVISLSLTVAACSCGTKGVLFTLEEEALAQGQSFFLCSNVCCGNTLIEHLLNHLEGSLLHLKGNVKC